MKKVDLFGCTTAEKLIKLQEAYDSLVNGLVGNAAPKGEYSSTVVYALGDMVENGGSSYLYINETAAEGIPVSNKTYWFQIAARGNDGKNGVNGNRWFNSPWEINTTIGMQNKKYVSPIDVYVVGDYIISRNSNSNGYYAQITNIRSDSQGDYLLFTTVGSLAGPKGDIGSPGPIRNSLYAHEIMIIGSTKDFKVFFTIYDTLPSTDHIDKQYIWSYLPSGVSSTIYGIQCSGYADFNGTVRPIVCLAKMAPPVPQHLQLCGCHTDYILTAVPAGWDFSIVK